MKIRRLLIAKQDSLRRQGEIDIELQLDEIRYVRRPERKDRTPVLDIITKESDLTLKFYSWARDGVHRTEAERFGEIVASFMQLPASEVPQVQIPELAAQKAEEPPALEG